MIAQFERCERAMRQALALLLAAGLAACAAKPTPEQTETADAAKRLSRQDVEATLIGNTISGVMENGDAYSEFYLADGSIRGSRGATGSMKHSGNWRFNGDEFCADYAEGDDYDWCASITVNGNQLFWLNEDGSVYNVTRPARIDPGNPNNL